MTNLPQRLRWTTADMPLVRGLHAVVTGGNSGLGFESVKALAARGATVTLACRDVAKGQAARAAIEAEVGPVEIDVRELDLASLVSIRDFAAHLSSSPIDLLLNNAGVMAPPRRETADGFELQFGTNHLGHFALTGHLWSGLLKSTAARVVTVASNAHKPGKINFNDLQSMQKYSAWGAYAQSKLANLLFMYELQRRITSHGVTTVKSLAAHPGYSATNLSMSAVPSGGGGVIQNVWRRAEAVIGQPASMGALPQLFAATYDLPGGSYVGPDGWGEWRGYPKLVNSIDAARDADIAAELWEVSETLTGVKFLD